MAKMFIHLLAAQAPAKCIRTPWKIRSGIANFANISQLEQAGP
jgi:hypothetical protein